jgi:hypothetical protein
MHYIITRKHLPTKRAFVNLTKNPNIHSIESLLEWHKKSKYPNRPVTAYAAKHQDANEWSWNVEVVNGVRGVERKEEVMQQLTEQGWSLLNVRMH